MADNQSVNSSFISNDSTMFSDDEFDVLGFLVVIRTKIVYIVLLFILGGLLSGLYTKYFIKPTYTAMSKLYISSASSDSLVNLSDLQISSQLTADYEQLLFTRPILENVIKDLNLEGKYTTESLRATVTITNPKDSRMLYISVQTTSQKESMDIANALAEQAVEQLGDLMDSKPPKIAETAIYPKSKTSPSLSKNALLGCVALPAVYILILLVIFALDNKINDEEDVEKCLGIMPIAVIPDMNKKLS